MADVPSSMCTRDSILLWIFSFSCSKASQVNIDNIAKSVCSEKPDWQCCKDQNISIFPKWNGKWNGCSFEQNLLIINIFVTEFSKFSENICRQFNGPLLTKHKRNHSLGYPHLRHETNIIFLLHQRAYHFF